MFRKTNFTAGCGVECDHCIQNHKPQKKKKLQNHKGDS